MYTQASTSKVAIMEWITMHVLFLKAGSCFALHPSGEICPEANLISWLQRVTLVTGREKDFVGNSVVRMRAFMRGTAMRARQRGNRAK
jgi:hypothetical protein